MTDAQRVETLKSLIQVLTSALKIVKQTHYSGPSHGFTPEKTKAVVDTALICAKAGEAI